MILLILWTMETNQAQERSQFELFFIPMPNIPEGTRIPTLTEGQKDILRRLSSDNLKTLLDLAQKRKEAANSSVEHINEKIRSAARDAARKKGLTDEAFDHFVAHYKAAPQDTLDQKRYMNYFGFCHNQVAEIHEEIEKRK